MKGIFRKRKYGQKITKRLTRFKLSILELGLTQREISIRSGVDQAIISLIANGKYNPDDIQKQKIADAMGMPVNDFFGKTN